MPHTWLLLERWCGHLQTGSKFHIYKVSGLNRIADFESPSMFVEAQNLPVDILLHIIQLDWQIY